MSDYLESLNEEQLAVIEQCLTKYKAGWSVDLGFGKTRMSIAAAKHLMGNEPILFITSKTLIPNTTLEIDNAFKGKIKYFVYHKDYYKKINEIVNISQLNCDVVITTPETVRKYYNEDNIQSALIEERVVKTAGHSAKSIFYNVGEENYNDVSFLYSTFWGSVIIDEFHDYADIEAERTRAMVALPGRVRYALSGTITSDSKPETLLGYYLFIQDPNFPRSLPEVKKFIKTPEFTGLNETFIIAKSKPLDITVNKYSHIVPLGLEGEMIYRVIRNFLLEINAEANKCKVLGDTENFKKLNGQRLGLLTSLRECIVSPLIPLTKMAINLFEHAEFNELAKKFNQHIRNLGIDYYLDDPANIITPRIKQACDIVTDTKIPTRKTLIFTPWRAVIKVLMYQLKKDTNKYIATLEGNMTLTQRGHIIDNFIKCDEGVLIMTYKIGGKGLNLQVADSVVFVDYDWKTSDTLQALARTVRRGQTKDVNIHYLYSNTGVEDAVLKKQHEKAKLGHELLYGPSKTTVSKIKLDQIIRFLDNEKATERFDSLYINPTYNKEIVTTKNVTPIGTPKIENPKNENVNSKNESVNSDENFGMEDDEYDDGDL